MGLEVELAVAVQHDGCSALLWSAQEWGGEEGDDADVLNCECLTHEYKSFPFLYLHVEGSLFQIVAKSLPS